jgi:molecular chaperone HtpG
MPNQETVKADKILEINPDHELFKALSRVYESNPDTLEDYANLLYHQALLIEGLPIEDPVKFSNLMVKLMVASSEK